ncbi:MAG: non-canonical purine NTP pyrophosphatase [Nanoarchaeota archaeon]
MNELYFITGNENKLREAQSILPNIKGLNIDLIEIQSIDSKKIIEHKLNEAKKHHSGTFIVEDTSLELVSMKGLPGPLVKFFEKSIGLDGISRLSETFGNKAIAKVVIGYFDGSDVNFYEGMINGTIVSPRGDNGFGWDKIFVPEGYYKTFAEMSHEEKNSISMRKIAFEKLKEYSHGKS